MARRKKHRKVAHRRRRKMGATNSDLLEMMIGGVAGSVGAEMLINSPTMLASIPPETKAIVLGGVSYFLPQMIKGPMGVGLAVGIAGSAGLNVLRDMGIVTGVFAGVNQGLNVVGKPAPGMPFSRHIGAHGQHRIGAPGQGLSVVAGVPGRGMVGSKRRYMTNGMGTVFAGL